MAAPKGPLFLERRRYRVRRLMDAVRLLPVIGVVLWMIPLLWPSQNAAPTDEVTTSEALLYIFGVWLALIVCSGLLWFRLRGGAGDAEQQMHEDDAF